ncbi:hypothetical protein EVAR_70520_1 [Eumeta japonica]|uniref:Uncharacterized protein n=1 Tax=Eumeta variegata TaxID=151549 RepID=A0A4C1SRE2_EUMVA|nr:hypothetical protein EVAR_70520_1 [Eumeta japonica]
MRAIARDTQLSKTRAGGKKRRRARADYGPAVAGAHSKNVLGEKWLERVCGVSVARRSRPPVDATGAECAPAATPSETPSRLRRAPAARALPFTRRRARLPWAAALPPQHGRAPPDRRRRRPARHPDADTLLFTTYQNYTLMRTHNFQ